MKHSARVVGPSSKVGSDQHERRGALSVEVMQYETCDGCGLPKPVGSPHAPRWSVDSMSVVDCVGRVVPWPVVVR